MEITLEHVEPKEAKTFGMPKNPAERIRVWREEIDGYYLEMVNFDRLQPDEVFGKLSSWTARVSYMRGMIVRSETRFEAAFRTKEIDFFLTECDRQFKIWSRVFSVNSLDWNLAGRGQQ